MKKTILPFLLFIVFTALCADEVDSLIACKDFPRAEAVLKASLGETPKNNDLRLRLALVQSWQSKFEPALNNFRIILASHPDNAEATIGLANCYLWQGDREGARKIVQDATTVADHEEYRAYLANLDAGNEPVAPRAKPTIRLAAGYEYTWNSKGMNDWNMDYQNASITFHKPWKHGPLTLTPGLFRERHRRYLVTDEQYGLTLYLKPSPRWNWGNELAIVPNDHFLPQLKYHVNLFYKPVVKWEWIVSGGYTFSDYNTEYVDKQVHVFQAGMEYYFPRDFYLAGRFYFTLDSDDKTAGSGMILASCKPLTFLTATVSGSAGTEIIDARSGNLSSWHVGAKLTADVVRWGAVYVSGGYGKWENDLIRRELGAGLQLTF